MATKQEIKDQLDAMNVNYDDDASYNDLQTMLKEAKAEAPVEPDSPLAEPETDTETDVVTAAKDAEIAALKDENAALKAPKGIPSLAKPQKGADGLIIRPEATLRGILSNAVTKKSRNELTDEEVVAVEREIRRYVKAGGPKKDPRTGETLKDARTGEAIEIPGGFKKGISQAAKARCIHFLKLLGRDTKNPTWDKTIIVPGFNQGK